MNSVSVYVCVRERETAIDRQTDRWGLENKDPRNVITDLAAHS